MLNHTINVLNSHLTVLRIPMPSVKSVTVLALVNTGSRYEPANWLGISHFLEHMVFKGTEKYPEAKILSAAVDAVGAKFNAFTSKEYTGYYVKADSKKMELALDVVSDMVLTPRLRQEDIDREKGVIIEEMNMYADMPSSHIGSLFEEMMYHPDTLGHDVIGLKDTVSNLKSEDFQAYMNQWYGLKNVVLVLSGDDEVLNQVSTIELVEKMFSKGNVSQRSAESFRDHLGPQPLADKKLHVEYKKTEQAHFVLGYPSFCRTDERRYALSLASIVLGGNMSSRLFSEVREKRGLCYYVHADTDFYHDTGLLGGAAGVDPKRVEEAVQVTVQEFLSIADGTKPITADELQKAKDYISGKFVLDLEDSESVAQYYGMKQLLLGSVETPDDLLKKFMAVTLDDVHKVVSQVIQKDQLRFAIIGPFEDKTVFENLLK